MITARAILAFLLTTVLCPGVSVAQEWGAPEDEECMMCHDDRSEYKIVDGQRVSMWVDYSRYAQSVHAEEGCISCHADVDVDDLPHEEDLEPVECDMCHDDPVTEFNDGLHGEALADGKFLAPTCASCHGKHDILEATDPNSPTFVMNIPDLCGDCHKEGTEVSELANVSQHEVLENYSQSIHGDGLFRRGLAVTAVCTSCHGTHKILPHEDPESMIHSNNVAATCMQCHAQIESVHIKVVDGELWEQQPHDLPICVDCHQPHEVRRVLYEDSFPDQMCMDCHSNPELTRTVNGQEESLFVDRDDLLHSDHSTIQCIKCHVNARTSRSPVCLDSGPVDCAMCHAESVDQYSLGSHGIANAPGRLGCALLYRLSR